jgi:hypothetical protein
MSMKGRKLARASLLICLALVGTLLIYEAVRFGGYFLAMHEDRECMRLGTHRDALESCLFLYTISDCTPSDRLPGFDYSAGTCVSYEIGGMEPIHAIFDSEQVLIQRISAYE